MDINAQDDKQGSCVQATRAPAARYAHTRPGTHPRAGRAIAELLSVLLSAVIRSSVPVGAGIRLGPPELADLCLTCRCLRSDAELICQYYDIQCSRIDRLGRLIRFRGIALAGENRQVSSSGFFRVR